MPFLRSTPKFKHYLMIKIFLFLPYKLEEGKIPTLPVCLTLDISFLLPLEHLGLGLAT